MANVLQWNPTTNSFSVSGATSVTPVVGEGIDNNFSVAQTFGAGILQTGSAGSGNQSPLLNVGDAFSDFIASGMQWAVPSSASLTTSMVSGSAYLNSVRTLVPAVSGNAFPASNDTYVSFNNSGTPAYQSVANGATAPTPNSGYVQTAKVVTSPIQSPTPTLSTSTSGSLASGTYGIVLVAFDATGYGSVGASGSVTVAASGSIDISWVNPLNETSMDIYATTAGSTTLGLVASGVTGTSYTYTGSVAPGAAAPTTATSNAIQSITPLLWGRDLNSVASVLDFGADPTGVLDSTSAFVDAMSASNNIKVPYGTYLINSANPMANVSSSIQWDVALGTTFTGNYGSTVAGGFASMQTNSYVSSQGKFFRYYDNQTGDTVTSTAEGFEIIPPSSGAFTQLLLYLGGNSNGNVTSGNVQCLLNLVQNVTDTNEIPSASVYKCMEIDVNAWASASGENLNVGTNGAVMGLLLTGGVANESYPSDCTYGILLQRTAANWVTGIEVGDGAYFAFVGTAQNTVYTANTYWNAPANSSQPSGNINRAFALDNIPSGTAGGQILAGSQITNGSNAIQVWRNTDTSSSGTFFRGTNQADTEDLILIFTDGSISTYAPNTANGSTVDAGSIACNGLTIRGSSNLQLGQAYTSGAPTATGYLIVYDSNGRKCQLLTA